MVLNTLFIEKLFFVKNSIDYISLKFTLDITGDIFSIIGLLIYLEIIELSFCDFDYNIKRTISSRAMNEQIEVDNEKDFIFLENGDVEEINKARNSIEIQIR